MKIKLLGKTLELDSNLISETDNEVQRQIEEYLNGDRKEFELKKTFPSNFTGLVMKEMEKIPYGETKSYGTIADQIDSSPIAVGQACGRNPLPIIIPCHRVTSKNGIGGYAFGIALKKYLIQLEKSGYRNTNTTLS